MVCSGVSLYGIFDNWACVLAETLGSESLLKSCCVPYGTRSRILKQNKWHLRKRVCWANEIVHYLVSPYSYLTLCVAIYLSIYFYFPIPGFKLLYDYFMNTLLVVDSAKMILTEQSAEGGARKGSKYLFKRQEGPRILEIQVRSWIIILGCSGKKKAPNIPEIEIFRRG